MHDSQTAELLALLEEVTSEEGYKVIVFFNTARLAGMYAELMVKASSYSVLEMHSRKSQAATPRQTQRGCFELSHIMLAKHRLL